MFNCVGDDLTLPACHKMGRKKSQERFDFKDFKEQSDEETYSLNNSQSAHV